MKNPTDDKTKLRHQENGASAVKPQPGQENAENEQNIDKTRIHHDKTVFKSKTTETESDKTRIAASQNHPAPDATRIKPQVEKVLSEDATRIAPSRPLPAVATNAQNNDRAELTSQPTSKYGVLKNRFLLEEVLGTGGMGIVYKAKDLLKVEANDRDPYVAIKVLSDEFKSHPEAFVSLQRESRKSQRIAHPNIVNVHDFDRDEDTVFMTMEYMEGKSLDKLIRQYKSTGLPTDDAWNIIKGMCGALIYAHEENIVHSDFKPGNVFVTDKGITKVFDFGIARAVAKAESLDENPEDKTLFDAGNLGALTPPYASLEMLQGEEPDLRDDIYALGCVAYELFTGEHPFNKLPADEAQKQNLKPKRITQLNKRQWKAIEKALAFKREDRIASVEKFLSECEAVFKLPILLPAVVIIIFALTGVIYFQYISEPEGPSEAGIRNELEYKIRMELHKTTMARLLEKPVFTLSWEDQVWNEIQAVRKIIKKQDPWLTTTEDTIYQLYLQQISDTLKVRRFKRTGELIENALRYTSDTTVLDEQRQLLTQAIEKNRPRDNIATAPVSKPEPVAVKKKTNTQLFDVALANVHQQLQCVAKIDMRDFDTAVGKLKSLDKARYNKLEPGLIKSLADCITEIGKIAPERAEEAKKYALRIFKSSRLIANIQIKPRDPCDASLAGLGARGRRAICKDKIEGGHSGPAMVVVPAARGIKSFAIGKYEVSRAELNLYCKTSKACSESTSPDLGLPAADIPFEVAKGYLSWLSKKTGKKYRLPTQKEWVYAAKSKSEYLDPNRNCKLSTRGIEKGAQLLKTSAGTQNAWGVINYAGNVQEWAYGSGKTILAVGGSYDTPMESCNTDMKVSHSGQADTKTGFRVLREIN